VDDGGSMYDVRALDPDGQLVDRAGLTADDMDQIAELMSAMGRLREVEHRLSEVAQRYMRLNQTDMRALQYLIVARNRCHTVTPGMLARHLGITTASTTKMLDRLERAGHISRTRHPTDRRAVAIEINPETALVARETVGRQQAHRFRPAAELDHDHRRVVINFLNATADALEQAAQE
jgi:DNA-binding MarR family transcriptional regulator